MGQGTRTVVWSTAAFADLLQVLEDLDEKAPGVAVELHREITAAARSLTTFSERGRWVPELQDRRTRELFVRNYRLMYEVHHDQVTIVVFVHGARDLAAWFVARQRR